MLVVVVGEKMWKKEVEVEVDENPLNEFLSSEMMLKRVCFMAGRGVRNVMVPNA